MLTFPAPFAAHLEGRVTSLTVCWAVTRTDDTVIRGTAHDKDIKIDSGAFAGTYLASDAIFATDVRSTSDGSVSNVDAEGAFRVDAVAGEITPEDIEGGFFDQAPAVLFMVNWQKPNDGQRILVSGTLGEFRRDSDGRYRTEVRGLAQALSQQIGRSYSDMCDVAVFGDSRCKLDLEPLTVSSTVRVVHSRKKFDADREAFPGNVPRTPVYYNHGMLTFTSGANSGVVREAKLVTVPEISGVPGELINNTEILLYDEPPYDVEVDDTFTLTPGCDRQYETCRLIHDNLVNFRGHGVFAPGRMVLMQGPNNGSDGKFRFLTEEELLEALLRSLA